MRVSGCALLSFMMTNGATGLPSIEIMIRAFYESDSSYEGFFFTRGADNRHLLPSHLHRKKTSSRKHRIVRLSDRSEAGWIPRLSALPSDGFGATCARVNRTSPRGGGEGARWTHYRKRTRRARPRSFDSTTPVQAPLRHDLPGVSPRPAHGSRPASGPRTGSVAEAKIASGFESASGFREAFNRIFGEPPSLAKRRPPLFVERFETPLGSMVAIADDAGLRLLELADRRALERELTILRRRLGTNIVPGTHPHLEAFREQIAEYFAGKRFEFTVQIAPTGSDFQQQTWKVLRSVPPAKTRSYSDGQRTRKGRSQPRRWTRQRE